MKEGSMRAPIFVVLTLSLSLARAADKLQTLNVKTGLWRVTTVTVITGEMPIPAELLARLTPQQRTRMEERIRARSPERTTTTTEKGCITREQLEQGPAFGGDRKQCVRTVVASTSRKANMKIECEQEGLKGDGILQFEALSPENVTGSEHIAASDGTHTMNSNSTITAQWIGPVCGGALTQ
jgi:hypothetical protein